MVRSVTPHHLDAFHQSGENVRREIPPLPIHQGTGVHRIDWRGCGTTHRERFRPARVPDALEACRNARTSDRDTAMHPPTRFGWRTMLRAPIARMVFRPGSRPFPLVWRNPFGAAEAFPRKPAIAHAIDCIAPRS